MYLMNLPWSPPSAGQDKGPLGIPLGTPGSKVETAKALRAPAAVTW